MATAKVEPVRVEPVRPPIMAPAGITQSFRERSYRSELKEITSLIQQSEKTAQVAIPQIPDGDVDQAKLWEHCYDYFEYFQKNDRFKEYESAFLAKFFPNWNTMPFVLINYKPEGWDLTCLREAIHILARLRAVEKKRFETALSEASQPHDPSGTPCEKCSRAKDIMQRLTQRNYDARMAQLLAVWDAKGGGDSGIDLLDGLIVGGVITLFFGPITGALYAGASMAVKEGVKFAKKPKHFEEPSEEEAKAIKFDKVSSEIKQGYFPKNSGYKRDIQEWAQAYVPSWISDVKVTPSTTASYLDVQYTENETARLTYWSFGKTFPVAAQQLDSLGAKMAERLRDGTMSVERFRNIMNAMHQFKYIDRLTSECFSNLEQYEKYAHLQTQGQHS